jgi:hypothetical protein
MTTRADLVRVLVDMKYSDLCEVARDLRGMTHGDADCKELWNLDDWRDWAGVLYNWAESERDAMEACEEDANKTP